MINNLFFFLIILAVHKMFNEKGYKFILIIYFVITYKNKMKKLRIYVSSIIDM